jgi:predicted PurR-regulated permease PerM
MVSRTPEDSAPSAAFRPDVPAPPEAQLEARREEGGAVEQPDLRKLGEALTDRMEVRSVAITGLFVLAVLYTLFFARAFLLPIVLAVLLDFLLSPVIRALKRVRIPEPLGAAVVILALLGGLGGVGYSLADPAREWVQLAPQSLAKVQGRLRELRRPVDQMTRTAEQVEAATEVSKPGPQEVVVRGPRLSERLFGSTQSILVGALETLILLYFLLAAGDLFLQKLIKVLPLLRDKKKAVAIARETEASISTYLLTMTVVNVGLGVAVTLVMLLLKMPNAVLWGTLAALAEFVPYIGATVMLGLLAMAGLVAFPDVGHALLVPGAYLAVNLVQANFISPTVLGRRLTLNPVAILVGLAFWWWIWGVGGAFIAVPLLATFKIFCDHIESLAPIGEFLGK